MPCTTLLVGKTASYDGSTIVARNEDAPGGQFRPKKFAVVRPADQPRTYTSVLGRLTIELPEPPQRYTALPEALDDKGIWAEAGVNEANVSMNATETLTTNERVLGADPLVAPVPAQGVPGEPGYAAPRPGGIGEEDMNTLVLPYIRSAREGVLRLGALLERYGTYEMNGIAFSDVDEIWWLETVGGHHWIARRVPDDCYVVMPNQLGIDRFDLNDAYGEQREHLCSADLRAWMDDNHLDLTLPGSLPAGVFNPREAFGSHSDADHVYNTPRSWAVQRFLSPHAEDWDGARGPESDDLPWCRAPERKLTMEDVKYTLSLHYQGTAYDCYGTRGDEHTRARYRPIGINRNGQLSAVQLRPGVPEAVRAVQWIAFGSNALVPLFPNVNEVPTYVANTDARVTTESFYWANRLVGALADAHFGACVAHVERYQQAVAARGHELVAAATRRVTSEGLGYAEAAPVLEEANAQIAHMLREKTDDLLAKVLFEASLGMKNGFSRSDG
jgi:dipeptidase